MPKIIVAADDLGALRHLKTALTEQGYNLVVAVRGPEKPLTLPSDRPFLVDHVADVEERTRLEQRLLSAEHILPLAQLLAGMSSDTLHQLTAIIGYTEMAQEMTEEGTIMMDYLDTILRAAIHISDQHRQFLFHAR